MATHPRFAQRAYFHWTYVAPDHILSDDLLRDEEGNVLPSLREAASSDGRCYVRVLRSLSCGTLYQALVAASSDLLHTRPFSIILTDEQLAYALPLDIRTEAKSHKQLDGLAKAHAMSVQPVCRKVAPEVSVLVEQSVEVPLQVCEEVEVSEEAMQEALDVATSDCSISGKDAACSVQQALLCLAIEAVMAQFHHHEDEKPSAVHLMGLKVRCTFLSLLLRWQKRTRQRVVSALSFVNEAGKRVWRLIVGAPVRLVLS